MSFGQRAALVRKQRNLTQKEVGEILGVVADIVSKYERDQMVPSIEVAAKFSKALNVSLDYLILGEADAGEGTDEAVMYKLRQLEKISEQDKAHVMAVIDAFVTKERLRILIT